MKRVTLAILLLVSVLLTAACSSSTSVNKNQKEEKAALRDVEIRLKNVEYMLPSEMDKYVGQLVLKIDVSIKNNRKEMIHFGSNDFELLQGNTEARRALPTHIVEVIEQTSLDAGKRIEGSLFYYVNKGEPIKLVFTSDLNKDGLQETKGFILKNVPVTPQILSNVKTPIQYGRG
ncbi:DUF4352 domain-containing protein [Bacillus benzoevorans]|uniref:DUF4352 domain-containing protein n=1 Tax=Bacillus benzoevorans TaxID=1456 RepID=A0A7X0HUY0_9BACI|nr:DUF4352 domain-containing protein [Bacillus benzoevorans]MBB6446135.1 hypothetical protein [Bacillus benzoevorans]